MSRRSALIRVAAGAAAEQVAPAAAGDDVVALVARQLARPVDAEEPVVALATPERAGGGTLDGVVAGVREHGDRSGAAHDDAVVAAASL